jgi:ribosomal protein S18 acetylase RimI-like enzyme
MLELPEACRRARVDDALAMTELVNMAGEGLPFYLWSQLASGSQSAWDIGQERARRDYGGFSFRNTVVRAESGKVVAALIGYPLDDTPEPVDYSSLPSLFVPLQELEDMAPGTWYVNVLATYPQFRGKGYGSELLGIAESIARDTDKHGLSIIVADTNKAARRLYERAGYREKARRPLVKEQFQHPGKNWVLLVKMFNNQEKATN